MTDELTISRRSRKILKWMRYAMFAIGFGSEKRNLKFYISFFCICYQFILLIADIAVNIKNPAYILDNLTETMGIINVSLCFTVMWFHKSSINEVIGFIESNSDMGRDGSYKEREIFDSNNLILDKLLRILRVYMIPCVAVAWALPILSRRQSDEDVVTSLKEYPLPLHLYQYYTITNEVTYFLTYVFRILLMAVDVTIRLNVDFLFVITIFYLSGQISILVNRIENLSTIQSSKLEGAMKNVIENYQNLIWIGNEIRKIFSFYLCGYLLLSTFILCLTSYQLLDRILKGNYFDAGISSLYTFALATAVFVNCLLGEYLITQSSNLERGFYNCLWYNATCNFRHLILVSLIRSQKPFCLNAGGFAIVGLPTLTAVMKTTAGYLSLLRAVMTFE